MKSQSPDNATEPYLAKNMYPDIIEPIMPLQTGKLPRAVLERMLKFRGAKDPKVLLGPRIGEDAAVIDLGERCLVLKTDPITYAIDEIGWYAVHINANDIAVMGARPRWFQACILMPAGTSEKTLEAIFKQIDSACRELGIALVGGHTEITPWLDRPIVIGDMQGLVPKKRLVLTSNAKAGDVLLLTKGAGIEGTATIAREKKEELKGALSRTLLRKAMNYLYDPGISIVQEAEIASSLGASAMHDPTEGGVAMGLFELAMASGKGLVVDRNEIIVRKETGKICEHFGIDPLGLLGSGALLITISKRKVDTYIDRLSENGIESSAIGEMARKSDDVIMVEDGRRRRLRYKQRDEILKVL